MYDALVAWLVDPIAGSRSSRSRRVAACNEPQKTHLLHYSEVTALIKLRLTMQMLDVALLLFTCEGEQTQHNDPGVRLEAEVGKQKTELLF